MTRFTKENDGMYHIHGKKYQKITGTRAEVWHGTAYETTGNIKKHELMMNKHGRIVSKIKHATAKKEKRLVKAGYLTKKGKFGYVRRMEQSKTKKYRGGKTMLTPSNYPDSVKDSTSSKAVFPTTSGGAMASLNPSAYPFGQHDDPNGLGSISQQSFLKGMNNTPNDLALLKSTGGKRKHKHNKSCHHSYKMRG
jgi:hypothetical protein